MPSYPVLQPNGKIAVWSTVVDHFMALDCEPGEAIDELCIRYPDRTDVTRVVSAVERGEMPYNHWWLWWKCLAWAIFRFGEDDETVRLAISITPDMTETRTYLAEMLEDLAANEAEYARQEVPA